MPRYPASLMKTAGVTFPAIGLYDAKLKGTWLGPIAMGLCRMLNVLLGMSAAEQALGPANWLAAGAVGVYIAGVTWLARSEVGPARRRNLTLATLVILAGIAALLFLPGLVVGRVPLLVSEPTRWYLLIGVLGTYTAMRCFYAVSDPEPDVIQAAVKHCILSLVFLDGMITYVVWDATVALTVIVVFWLPAYFLGRWIYST